MAAEVSTLHLLSGEEEEGGGQAGSVCAESTQGLGQWSRTSWSIESS